jgi:phenylpropionate dioxygenase-like ring-hydroxylating dioxygenase large terminal subunit
VSERRYPFAPFPNGWFQVAFSEDLAPGAVRPLHAFGRRLVLYRSEGGEARVFDAYCPHLGADLGVGGKVEGDSIRCPFHGWRYGADGACVEVPYAKRIPPAAKLRAWSVREHSGLVTVWHHAEGKEPDHEIPPVAEYGDPAWTPYERRSWRIRTHNHEMGENQVDRAHFRYVHGTLEVPECEAEADGPVFRVYQRSKMQTPRGPVVGKIDITAFGYGVSLVRFSGIVDTLLIACVTPVDGEHVDVQFVFTVKKLANENATKGVGLALIADIEKQMREDTPIWEHKVYHERPLLCDGDGPIAQYRRWTRQFYSEGVPA